MKRPLLIFTLCCPSFAAAEVENTTGMADEYFLKRDDLNAPSAYLQFGWSGDSDFKSSDARISYTRLTMRTALYKPVQLTDNLRLLPTLRYESTWFDLDGIDALNDVNVHTLAFSFNFFYNQPGSKWSFIATATPGISSDFSDVNGDDFYINGLVGAKYRWNDDFSLLIGAGSVRRLGGQLLLPAIGFEWRPSDCTYVSLRGPVFTAAWQPHEDWIIRAMVLPGGGVWNVKDKETSASYDIKQSNFQGGLLVERRLSQHVWLTAWGGLTFANEVEIETASGGNTVFEDDIENGWFVYTGLRVAVW
ncbi:DUF6268 family outer membrane beta-barrel protein [Persicirhabdus sediminis]|uniref:DUF6268 domain-containing protein n=1 Tax=Persicirhabdus sediminis TaxID=454144 RepID=A0A8J7MFU4_9BACT|nr:DUF6268 family outer membrane beta-barrel protein [Persicirhabdus sediminis]MBK1792035.1 hypothetical protein [Persicirhabdus sediminis]